MARIPGRFAPALALFFLSLVLPAQEPRGLRWTEADVQAKSLFNSGSEKIDPGLLAIAASAQSKGLDGLEATAKSFGVSVQGDLVPVTLIAEDSGDVAKLRREVIRRGGTVSLDYKNRVFATLPAKEIPSLGQIDSLYSAVRPAMYYADQEATKASPLVDGVLKIQADRMQKAGFRGQGVKIGILDFGFQGYEELRAAGYVPAAVQSRAFNSSGKVENGTIHGAACAEIIHAMAPDAQLYLAAAGMEGHALEDEILQAANWLQEQGVDIISYSGGGQQGPHNGTSVGDQMVAAATKDHHILWVNSAGNSGDEHMLVNASPGAGEWIPISSDTQLLKVIPAGPKLSVTVNWDDWGDDPLHPTSTQDIDIKIFHLDKQGNVVDSKVSNTMQNGRNPPKESIDMPATAGDSYYLGLHPTHVTRPVRVHIYSNGGELDPSSPTGSIAIPATSPAALSVGAVDVTNGKLESFSSRGPTDDNRANQS